MKVDFPFQRLGKQINIIAPIFYTKAGIAYKASFIFILKKASKMKTLQAKISCNKIIIEKVHS